MKFNPLMILRTIDKKTANAKYESFAGPYVTSEAALLWPTINDAIQSCHGVYLTRAKTGSRTSVTIYLHRNKFTPTALQKPREIFESIEKNTPGVELQTFRRCINLGQCVQWVEDMIKMGHSPVFVECHETGNLIPGMKRNFLDTKQPTKKHQHTN